MSDWSEYLKQVRGNLSERNTLSKGDTMPYEEAVMTGNFVKLANDDIKQTIEKVKPEGSAYYEGNPAVAPILNNTSPDVFRALGLIGQYCLMDRWRNMQDPKQKAIEQVIANVIEANAMHTSKEPWKLSFGLNL